MGEKDIDGNRSYKEGNDDDDDNDKPENKAHVTNIMSLKRRVMRLVHCKWLSKGPLGSKSHVQKYQIHKGGVCATLDFMEIIFCLQAGEEPVPVVWPIQVKSAVLTMMSKTWVRYEM